MEVSPPVKSKEEQSNHTHGADFQPLSHSIAGNSIKVPRQRGSDKSKRIPPRKRSMAVSTTRLSSCFSKSSIEPLRCSERSRSLSSSRLRPGRPPGWSHATSSPSKFSNSTTARKVLIYCVGASRSFPFPFPSHYALLM